MTSRHQHGPCQPGNHRRNRYVRPEESCRSIDVRIAVATEPEPCEARHGPFRPLDRLDALHSQTNHEAGGKQDQCVPTGDRDEQWNGRGSGQSVRDVLTDPLRRNEQQQQSSTARRAQDRSPAGVSGAACTIHEVTAIPCCDGIFNGPGRTSQPKPWHSIPCHPRAPVVAP